MEKDWVKNKDKAFSNFSAAQSFIFFHFLI